MHTLKLWKSSKIKKSFQTPEWSSTFSTPPWGGSQAPSPRCQEASGRTMVLVTVRIRTRLSHRPGADGYGNRLQSYNTFLCPKHEQRSWDTEEVWKLGDKNQVGSLHTMHREVAHGTQEEDKTGHSQHGWPVAKSCSTPWTGAPASLPGFTAPHCLRSLLIHAHWDSDAIQSSHPLPSLLLLLSVFPNTRGPFSMNRLLASRGQSIGASASVSVFPMNIRWIFRVDFL